MLMLARGPMYCMSALLDPSPASTMFTSANTFSNTLSKFPSAPINELVEKSVGMSPDYSTRLKLSKLIGLKDVPEPDPNAIDRLSGVLTGKIEKSCLNSVELIKEVRGRE